MTRFESSITQKHHSVLTYEQHLEAMKRVNAYKSRHSEEFDRKLDSYRFALRHIGYVLLCFLPHDEETIWRVKEALKHEFGDFGFHTWANWVGTNARMEQHWAKWVEDDR